MFEAHQKVGYWTAEVRVPQLNASVAADFQTAFGEAVAKFEGPVVLNLEQVNFMDSSGLAAIVFSFKSLAMRKELLLCGVKERVAKSLEIAGMIEILTIFNSQEDAIASLNVASQH